jgi:16S rRNA (cytidine1402-2'-O)-methyltransferase
MPTLYIVSTPIGNLEDITLRALRVLGEVGLIAAEDTRVTRRLLTRYDIDTPLTSYHEHNKLAKIPDLLAKLEGIDIALVSDAGTPGVNDPGQELVMAAASTGHDVIGIPGASAITTAIAVSGIAMEGFVYLGFLPRNSGERQRLLKSVISERRSLVLFETPHRLKATLKDAQAVLGDRELAVCRELTKLYEETYRGTISEASEHFDNPRGEFTLMISGATSDDENAPKVDARPLLEELHRQRVSARDAVAQISEATGLGRRELYRIWVELTKESDYHPPV